jgi:hypothetical protein
MKYYPFPPPLKSMKIESRTALKLSLIGRSTTGIEKNPDKEPPAIMWSCLAAEKVFCYLKGRCPLNKFFEFAEM